VSPGNFLVLTPQPGEAARLIGASTSDIQADRLGMAQRLSHQTGACVVLKGSRTVVAGVSGETWINMTGNPALAKGGSGDVLSGMIGAALARRPAGAASSAAGNDEEYRRDSGAASAFFKDLNVSAAVHLHGLAGGSARDMLHENAVLATDLLENLAKAFRNCELQMDRRL